MPPRQPPRLSIPSDVSPKLRDWYLELESSAKSLDETIGVIAEIARRYSFDEEATAWIRAARWYGELRFADRNTGSPCRPTTAEGRGYDAHAELYEDYFHRRFVDLSKALTVALDADELRRWNALVDDIGGPIVCLSFHCEPY